MDSRILDVTSETTLDFVPARAEGPDWTHESVGVLDVASPRGTDEVTLGLELDAGSEDLPHHVDRLSLTPEAARAIAADLEAAASAAEAGEATTSRRG